jgi:hypothetical protein
MSRKGYTLFKKGLIINVINEYESQLVLNIEGDKLQVEFYKNVFSKLYNDNDNDNDNDNKNKKMYYKNNELIFYASKIIPLSDFLQNFNNLNKKIEKMVFDLGMQISILKEINKGILFFNLDDIVVLVDDNDCEDDNDNNYDNNYDCEDGNYNKYIFLLINWKRVLPYNDSNNNITLTYPLKIDITLPINFLAPEIKNIVSLPFSTNMTCVYYSLALLAKYCLGLDKNMDTYSKESIYGSKLYFLLERCLQIDIDKRFFLYI